MSYDFEELPFSPNFPAEGWLVWAIVEQDPHTLERTVWNEQERRFTGLGYNLPEAFPAPYGWIPQTVDLGDGDALDVLVLTEEKLPQASWLPVRPVGILLRTGGDNKVLTVPPEHPIFGNITELDQLSVETLAKILKWFPNQGDVHGWGSAAVAREAILEAHALFKSRPTARDE